ncbi:putative RNA polymerase II subunit B1 CTD phosphatase RPAP2 isoform X1 [Bubalus bubalis]|uniref:putative RNA polymerase II subunit B1 CTD phosphatase RPAP2 isoform X1 n=2 Tax=Bubalus bubalis TaxID=89462 RepID=UPI00042CE2CA|nr:putative RNA polymerase II subunit B1 CTD phosphatase RPAP2 isoform X1 [Bubalus bubalis]XP_006061402.1 putative RNA polymerase II subunit B1 CTD phosphatase RPAP2 isoform X1 [Bubalus bubalis]XP_006061403.1 putative RNA polymerase II subunit B1 CTD phosphatase RPAP2 isoform X1 [Bubalus bubalis]XP_006061404.1 putative RNA polymerase II subunit B1 CTD phosphatase RPAP2 isoform X1 [Bubalus bubalis]XP_006061405.1 putative RNA polymerase II subunit B1 CTD phosphatase RPAP2 isoform X1 [Bubalus buba
MADWVGPCSAGRKARRPRASRVVAGTKQTSALNQEDASQRKAEVEAAMRKKIEFERKALHIVEQLLEENISEEFLRECGKFITPAHYSDVVDERSIIKLCGYPLCQNKLGIVPKQKYKISTKTNKVYDITERKCFCSNFCYKASKFFEAQIPKSPVWVREEERHPDFQLLQDGQSGPSGEEIQLCSKAIKTSDIDSPGHFEKHYESGSSSTHSDSSSDNEQDFVSSILPGNRPNATRPQLHKKSIMKKKAGQKVNSQPESKEQTVVDVIEQLGNCRLDNQEKATACELPLQNVNTQISSNSSLQKKLEASEISDIKYSSSKVTLVGISKKSAEHFKRKFAKSNQVSGSASSSLQVCPEIAKANLLKALKETLIEWKTEETLRFLYGQKYASVCLKSSSTPLVKEELDEDDTTSDPGSHSPALQELNSLDESLPFRASDTAIKPLPSYENLKKETETLNLRIREFYRGRYVLNEETTKSQDSEEHDPTFPLIDSSSQNQIRKRIVLEKLNKVLPGLLGPLQITLGDIYTQLKNLVQTFRLTNRNIIHKPAEWTLIALVLLSILTSPLGIQKLSQENVMFTQFMTTLLEELHLKNEDLESLTIIFRTSC